MSESFSVIYSPEAVNDLREIYTYIAYKLLVPKTAEGQINRIRDIIRSLDFMPLRYPIVDWEPWKSIEMHKLPIDNFIVFYIVSNEKHLVTIVRILYGGRDIKIVFNEK